MAIAAGLTDTGNPTLIGIGAAVIAVHAIAEAVVNALKNAPGSDAGAKAEALIPILSEQIVNVQTLVHTVEDQAKIIKYRLKGYEVTPHVDAPAGPGPAQTALHPPEANAPPDDLTSLVQRGVPDPMPGAQHQIIGIPRP